MPVLADRIIGIILGCLLLPLVSVLPAAAQGSIQGRVTQADVALAGQRIMLIRFGPNRDVQRIPGQTDAQGYFVFEQLETGEQFEYIVGIRYQGQLYRSAPVILHRDEQRTGVILDIKTDTVSLSDAASEQSMPLQMSSHHIVVVPQEDRLRIREILKILNTSTTDYVGKALPHTTQHVSLRLPLPPDHRDLNDVEGLLSEHLHYYPSGLYYTAPLAAGEHRIAYTYSLPVRPTTTTLLSERFLPTAVLDILVADQNVVVASDLPFVGHVSLDAHVFARFQGTNLLATSRAWVQFTVRREGAMLLKIAAYACVIGIAVAAIVTPFVSLRQRRTSTRTGFDHSTQHAVEASHLQILRNIVHLDRQQEAGVIDAAFYQQHRDAYTQQLSLLMQQQRPG